MAPTQASSVDMQDKFSKDLAGDYSAKRFGRCFECDDPIDYRDQCPDHDLVKQRFGRDAALIHPDRVETEGEKAWRSMVVQQQAHAEIGRWHGLSTV